jgi:hypothetical protein
MSRNESHVRLDELLSRLMDGLLTDAERAELEERLRRDPAARERYRLHVACHVELASHPREIPARLVVTFRQKASLPLAAAAAVALIVGSALWLTRPAAVPGQAAAAPVPPIDHPVLAVASRVDDAAWDLRVPLATGTKLRHGEINLTAGMLVLDLTGGQQLTLRAPARFDLLGEREMLLHSGDAALRVVNQGPPYIIRVPGGAVVDLGTEISVKVGPDGSSDVRVFEGLANASVVDSAGRTRQEMLVRAGEAVRIGKGLETSQSDQNDFVRTLPRSDTDRSPAGEAYAAAVTSSRPLAWWRFDGLPDDPAAVAPQAGDIPLMLVGQPQIAGSEGRRFLLTNPSDASGYAMPPAAIPGLDTDAGFTIECLIHPLSEANGTAIAIDQPDLSPPSEGRLSRFIRHPPQRLVIERMGLRGSNIGHIHPDYALRAMTRTPAGYVGGSNTYSAESHLMHRWIHVAFTHDGRQLRLYIDGHLSDEFESDPGFQNAALRPIIGRMQPTPQGELRQWHGGIDEVALYGRALDPADIRRHADALEH